MIPHQTQSDILGMRLRWCNGLQANLLEWVRATMIVPFIWSFSHLNRTLCKLIHDIPRNKGVTLIIPRVPELEPYHQMELMSYSRHQFLNGRWRGSLTFPLEIQSLYFNQRWQVERYKSNKILKSEWKEWSKLIIRMLVYAFSTQYSRS